MLFSTASAVDPTRIWGTYYGGADLDEVLSTCVDASGNVYISGTTTSTSGVAQNGYQNALGGPGARDAFLAKFSPSGTRLWATYFGGALPEAGYCAVDGGGNVYLAGWTYSTSGIAFNGHQNTSGGGRDAFLAKFNTDGALLWSTYYGGAGDDQGKAVVADVNGNVWLVGLTGSATGIAANGAQMMPGGGEDAFLVMFNSGGVRQWGTFFGGSGADEGYGVSLSGTGGAYLTGYSNSVEPLSTLGPATAQGGDAFIARFGPTGTREWSRYLGGSGDETGFSCIARDGLSVYVAGSTSSTSGFASGGHQMTYGGSTDAFLTKLSSAGAVSWSTYYGGTGLDQGLSCAVDAAGRVYLAGTTHSTTNIGAGGFQNTPGGGEDGFLAKFTPAGVRLWGTYYGGASTDRAMACAADAGGDVFLAGICGSSDGIASSGHQMNYAGSSDGFVARLAGSALTAAVAVRVMLGGAFNAGLMNDALRSAGLIPATEPYTALGYTHVSNTSGTVPPATLNVTGSDAIVDWVVVELRDANAPGVRVVSRSALVQRDGDVVDVDGVSPLFLDVAPGSYHVAVQHRNHLGVMTALPVTLGAMPTLIYFTLASTSVWGTNARTTAGSTQVLWAGDATGDGTLKYTGSTNDRDPILIAVGSTTPNNTVSNVYDRKDTNLDGVIKYTGTANDRDIILTNVGSTTPNNTRTQQLP